jgi:DNA repair photolyase
MKKFKERPEEWGYFVDVKVNAPIVLAKEVKKIKPPKEVFMSSICDAWQPMEAKYRLSRDCLKVLLEAGFSVSMLTKSSLILRDFDILAAHKNASLGMTITTLEPGLQKALEPYASPVKDRLNTLKQA